MGVHCTRDSVQASDGEWGRRIGGIIFIFYLTAFFVQLRTAEEVAPVGVCEVGKGFQAGRDRVEPIVKDDVELRCDAPRGEVEA